jgi:hypothetical protein
MSPGYYADHEQIARETTIDTGVGGPSFYSCRLCTFKTDSHRGMETHLTRSHFEAITAAEYHREWLYIHHRPGPVWRD